MRNMAANLNKFIAVLAIASITLIGCNIAAAFSNYDVEWVSSNSKTGVHVLSITIEDCKTLFKIKTEDIESLERDKDALKKLVAVAIKRWSKGCKN